MISFMNKLLPVLLFSIFISIHSQAQTQSKDEMIIRETMDDQQKAWNDANLEGFMQGYWQSDSLMFIGKSGITYGWQNTLNNYKKGYPDAAAMGKLLFTIVEIKRLSVLYFHVVGKWQLTKTAGNAEGYSTLLFKKIKGKWLIVSDHSD